MKSRLEDDLRQAMRSGDTLRRDVIRYLKSEIHNQEIAGPSDLDDEGVLRVLSRQAQQRRESIRVFKDGHRADLVEKEETELAIILEYLPRQLSKDELRELVERAVKDVEAKGPEEMGKVMGRLMPEVRGRAEGREVSAIASEVLRGLDSSRESNRTEK